jgi:hypothetical protein
MKNGRDLGYNAVRSDGIAAGTGCKEDGDVFESTAGYHAEMKPAGEHFLQLWMRG